MKEHYQDIFDSVFGSTSPHRTLRTLFDPGSSEWEDTTMERKLQILKKLLDSGKISMNEILRGYKHFYKNELKGKAHVVDSLENGLALLLESSLK